MMNFRQIRIFICMILFILKASLHAQVVLEERLQLYLLGEGKQYGVVPIAEKGLVIFNETRNYNSSSKLRWEITQLDTMLQLQSKSFFESENNFKISQVKYHSEFIYLLFQDLNVPMKSAFFVRGNVFDNNFEIFELKDFLPDKIIGLEILGNSLFLIGLNDRRPTVLKYKYGDPRPQVLRGLSPDKTELLNTALVPGHNLIQITTRMKKNRSGNGILIIKQFDEMGNIQKDIVIESTRGHNLLNCRASTDKAGDVCVVGTFSYGNSKMSNGIFTLVHDGKNVHPAYFYEYGNLHNYFNYLSSKERDKIIKKYKLEDSSSKSSKYKDNQVPREIVRTDQGWVYLGEIVNYTEKNSRLYGNMWQMEYYTYSHALVLGIGIDGKLKWDNSMGLNDLTTDSEIQQTNFDVLKDQMVLFYQKDSNIFYEIMQGSRPTDVYGNLNLFNASSGNYSQNQVNGTILPWYKHKYIAFGSYHSMGNENENNKYFYVNKIAVSPEDISN